MRAGHDCLGIASVGSYGDAQLVKWLALLDPMLRIGGSIPTASAVRFDIALSINRHVVPPTHLGRLVPGSPAGQAPGT